MFLPAYRYGFIFLVAIFFLQFPCRAEEQISASGQEVIDLLGKRVEQEQRLMAGLLARYGFPPQEWNGQRDWHIEQLSALEQLEFAWRAAEKASPGSGDMLLANVTSDYREVNSSVGNEDVLKGLTHSGRVNFNFSLLQPVDLAQPLPPKVELILDAVSRHADAALRGHMGRCCAIEGAKARDVLRAARDPKDALRLALQRGELPPEMAKRVAALLESVSELDSAVAFEKELADIRDQLGALSAARNGKGTGEVAVLVEQRAMEDLVSSLEKSIGAELQQAQVRAKIGPADLKYSRDVLGLAAPADHSAGGLAPFMPGNSGLGAGGGDGGGGMRSNAARNAAFDLAQYGTKSRVERQFVRVVARAGGRGGVVFGNAVSAGPGLPRPVSVAWVPLDPAGAAQPSPTLGVFRIKLVGGGVAFSRPLPAAEALAAVRLIFTGLPGISEPVRRDEEIGVAGLDSHFEVPSVKDNRVAMEFPINDENRVLARGTSYVVHPLIADTPVGRSAIVTDGLLMGKSVSVVASLLAKGVSTDQAKYFEKWFRSVKWTTYKFIDVPMQVRLSDNGRILRAVRTDGAGGPLLTLRRFGNPLVGGADGEGLFTEDPAVLSTVLTTLIDASDDIARLNRFAEVLGVLRWVRHSHGVWIGGLSSTPGGIALSAMFISGEQIKLAPSKEAFAASTAQLVHEKALEILREASAPQALVDLDNDVLAQRSRLIAISGLQRLFDRATVVGSLIEAAEQPSPPDEIVRVFRAAESANERQGEQEAREVLWQGAIKTMPEGRLADALESERKKVWGSDPGQTDARATISVLQARLDPKTLALLQGAEARQSEYQASLANLERRAERLGQLVSGQATPSPDEIQVLASEAVRKAYEDSARSIAAAESENPGWASWYRLRRWWLGTAPSLDRLKQVIDDNGREQASMREKLDSARKQAEGAIIPGFVAWRELHRSYGTTCPTGVCTD
jgi:hypothetical protein